MIYISREAYEALTWMGLISLFACVALGYGYAVILSRVKSLEKEMNRVKKYSEKMYESVQRRDSNGTD